MELEKVNGSANFFILFKNLDIPSYMLKILICDLKQQNKIKEIKDFHYVTS